MNPKEISRKLISTGFLRCLLLLVVLLFVSPSLPAQHHRFVDPRIGSMGLGRVFIGPSMPFGMVKPGPDCESMPNAGWAPMPEAVRGFSQTHVSGTGGGQKYGNILLQPYVGDLSGTLHLQSRTAEDIALGRYRCRYADGVTTEITTAERCALYRFRGLTALFIDAHTFLGIDTIPEKREAQQPVASSIAITGEREVTGWSTVRGGWNNGGPYTVFFCMQADRPFSRSRTAGGKYAWVGFEAREVNVKVGISFVSIEKARQNIVACGFDDQLEALRRAWEAHLRVIDIEGTDRQRRMAYTALYHTLLMPVDRTGENPHWQAAPYYDDYYAIWDTYRTSSPLLTLLYPDRQRDLIRSLLNIYRHEGYLPDARSGNWNGRTQGGSNAEVVIADAFAKQLDGIDYALALEAMVKDAEVAPEDDEKEGRGGLAEYNSLGFIPYGIPRAGTRTVEYSYDDWCIAQVARGLGKTELHERYLRRSGNWKHLWRADYEWEGMRGFIMPRAADGRWLDSVPWGRSQVYHPVIPYTPDTKVAPWYLPWWSTFFYEALSAEYSLSVPHDVPGLIALCGGKAAFRKRLDTFFQMKHYNVANEPSFLTPSLYHWVGRPDLSSERIQQIVTDCFDDSPTGLPGNDDSGAMSSWLLWHMMGLYPVAGQDLYLVNSPLLKAYILHLPGGRTLRVEARGTEWRDTTLTHGRLLRGGILYLPVHGKAAPKPVVRQPVRFYAPIPTDIPMMEARFVLNRQYRNWQLAAFEDDSTLVVDCNRCRYRMSRNVVEQAAGFCWESPQRPPADYHCTGTFLFISRRVMADLEAGGVFVYDGITWREVCRDAERIHVRADVDGTEMWIARRRSLPWVLEMRNNPLGIDWKLTDMD